MESRDLTNKEVIDKCGWCKPALRAIDKVYAEKMKLLAFQDTELSHINADELLLDILRELGFKEVVREFVGLDRWYS
jgi:hypothetical protein